MNKPEREKASHIKPIKPTHKRIPITILKSMLSEKYPRLENDDLLIEYVHSRFGLIYSWTDIMPLIIGYTFAIILMACIYLVFRDKWILAILIIFTAIFISNALRIIKENKRAYYVDYKNAFHSLCEAALYINQNSLVDISKGILENKLKDNDWVVCGKCKGEGVDYFHHLTTTLSRPANKALSYMAKIVVTGSDTTWKYCSGCWGGGVIPPIYPPNPKEGGSVDTTWRSNYFTKHDLIFSKNLHLNFPVENQNMLRPIIDDIQDEVFRKLESTTSLQPQAVLEGYRFIKTVLEDYIIFLSKTPSTINPQTTQIK